MLSSIDFEDRLRRLQRVSLGLNAALSVSDVVTAVIEVFEAPVSAPSRGLYLLDDIGENLVLAAQRGMPSAAAAQFERFSVTSDLPGAVAAREQRTIVSTAQSDAVAEFASLRGVPRSTNGFVAIPLLNDRACLGVLALGFNGTIDGPDISFLEAVAAQVAQAVTRVRLLERDQRRRVELEFLAQLTRRALDAADHTALMQDVCAAAVPTLGDCCALYFLAETATVPEVAFAHVNPEQTRFIEELLRRYPYDPSRAVGVPAVIRTGQTEFVPRLTPEVIEAAIAATTLSRDEAMPIVDRLEITSAITVALRTKRRVVGAMQFLSTQSGRHYDDSDVALAEAVAGRLAEALDSAWMADHQRAVSIALQRALLPPALPTIPGMELAARYWPAGIDAVGGDFYDVFQIAADEWAIVIGDVCGSGPDAAATTSIARHTVRAAARHGADPLTVIEWLNDAVLQSQRDRFCTVCYATVKSDRGHWTLTATAAGHPLPIVVTHGCAKTVGQPGSLLGVFQQITVRPERITLEPGDLVVLYTDGITDLPPPHGLDPAELADYLQQHALAGPDAVADLIYRSLLDRVPNDRRRDDAAVLVLAVPAAGSIPPTS